ncbi:hypothetical protein FO519_005689 [Halicephalobus sp. NKZ332]|nr:hypothetical protein FO519_005689 [Halicephalobus sp. NKZ332]
MLSKNLIQAGRRIVVNQGRRQLKNFRPNPGMISLASSVRCLHLSPLPASPASRSNKQNTMEEAAAWHGVPVVSTTHIVSGSNVYFGVFWDQGDPMNIYKEATTPSPNAFHGALEAVMVALRQALYERKLERVIVQTDSKYIVDCANRHLKIWRNNGYMKKDGTPVKHAELLDDFAKLLDMIEAQVRLIPSRSSILEHLKSDPRISGKIEGVVGDVEDYYKATDKFDETIFVAAKMVNTKGDFAVSGYGCQFQNHPSQSFCGRFANFPVTLQRAQLFGILQALKIAKENGLKNVQVVCDSGYFVKFYKRNWLKNDGQPCANFNYYKEIKDLADELNANFSFLPENSTDEQFENAKLLSKDGLAFPVIPTTPPRPEAKKRTSWMKNFQEDYDEELKKTESSWKDIPRVYLVSTNQEGKRYACIFNELESDLENTVSQLPEKGNVEIAKMVISVIEKGIAKGAKKVVIRTNEGHLPIYLFKYIPKWKNTGFVTALKKPVVGAEEYKKIGKLMEEVEVRIEYFANSELEKDKEAMEYVEEVAKELDIKVAV